MSLAAGGLSCFLNTSHPVAGLKYIGALPFIKQICGRGVICPAEVPAKESTLMPEAAPSGAVAVLRSGEGLL